ncbi:MAG: hypothetical protein JNJ57_05005, partial [Saprospiraceae bacterium]|nr:hypothetical protein [Saprospiraceae bacterium]
RSSSHTLYEKGLRLHRVQQDEKGYLETNWLGRDRFSVHEGNTMRIGRFRKNSNQQIEFSYIDQTGKLLTDWIWQEGPDYLASKNLVQFWGKDPLAARQAIIDAQGKTLFQLGDLMTDDPPHDRTDPWKINYLVVRKRVDAENLPEGLMDSTGNLVLPLAYNDLHVWQDGRFLTAKTTAGNTVLMTIDGKILHEFKPSNASILMQHVGPDNHGTGIGPIAIWIGAETILIDENNQVLRQFDLPYGRVFLSEKMARQYVVLIRNKQKIWANYRSGKLFVE